MNFKFNWPLICLATLIICLIYVIFKPDSVPDKVVYKPTKLSSDEATYVNTDVNSAKADVADSKPQVQTPTDSHGNKMSLGQMLAYIEKDEELAFEHPYVVRLDELIADLSMKYDEPKDTIAEYTSKCFGVLRENMVHETMEEFMQTIYSIRKMDNTTYKDMAAFIGSMQMRAGRK